MTKTKAYMMELTPFLIMGLSLTILFLELIKVFQ
jgi:hypothetical protein